MNSYRCQQVRHFLVFMRSMFGCSLLLESLAVTLADFDPSIGLVKVLANDSGRKQLI